MSLAIHKKQGDLNRLVVLSMTEKEWEWFRTWINDEYGEGPKEFRAKMYNLNRDRPLT